MRRKKFKEVKMCNEGSTCVGPHPVVQYAGVLVLIKLSDVVTEVKRGEGFDPAMIVCVSEL